MLVRPRLVGGNGLKLRIKSIELAFRSLEIQALEVVRDAASARTVWKLQAFFLARNRHHVTLALVGEEILQPDTEHQSNPQQGGERRKQLATFQFRQHGSRKAGVLPQFNQAHALSQAEGP